MPRINVYKIFEFFDWENEDKTLSLTFDINRITDDILKDKLDFIPVEAPIDLNWAKVWLIQRELNMQRVQFIANSSTLLEIPVLSVEMPNGSHLLIDGSHRYMARILRAKPDIKHFIIAYKDWQPYVKVTKGTLPDAI